jgi:hypothetical protein
VIVTSVMPTRCETDAAGLGCGTVSCGCENAGPAAANTTTAASTMRVNMDLS